MKKDRLLNRDIVYEVAALGHTEYICIADCGLPIPKGVRVIDLSVRAGIPRFLEVLDAVREELVVESIVLASEIDENNPALSEQMNDRFSDCPIKKVSHEDFKDLTKNAKCIIRTGEVKPYANVLLVGGVNF